MNVIYCLSVLYTLPTIHDHHLQHCSTEGRCQYSLHQCQSNRKGRESQWKTGARRRWDKRIWSHRQLAPCWRLFQFPMNHTRTCLQSSLKYLWKTQTDHDMRQGHTSAKLLRINTFFTQTGMSSQQSWMYVSAATVSITPNILQIMRQNER